MSPTMFRERSSGTFCEHLRGIEFSLEASMAISVHFQSLFAVAASRSFDRSRQVVSAAVEAPNARRERAVPLLSSVLRLFLLLPPPLLLLWDVQGARSPWLSIGTGVPRARPGRAGRCPAARVSWPLPSREPLRARAPMSARGVRSALADIATGVHILPSQPPRLVRAGTQGGVPVSDRACRFPSFPPPPPPPPLLRFPLSPPPHRPLARARIVTDGSF